MIPLVGRKIKVNISHRKRKSFDTLEEAFDLNSPATIKEAIEYDERFRIDFDFSRTADLKVPDTGTVQIYNPDLAFFADVQDSKDLFITLWGGYEDYTGVLISGICSNYTIEKKGVDNVVDLKIGDGLNGLDKNVNLAYTKGTKFSKMATDLVDGLKQAGVEIIADAKNLIKSKITGTSSSGKTFSGSSLRSLDKIMSGHGLNAVIANNELWVHEFAKPIERFSIVLANNTGLLNAKKTSIELKDKSDTKIKKDAVAFECLIIPDIVPGQQLQFKSKLINNNETTIAVVHSCNGKGSNFTNEFKMMGIAYEF